MRSMLPTACVHVGFFGNRGNDGAQAEAICIPYADGTLFAIPVQEDDALMPSLLTLADVMGTGHHAAVASGCGTIILLGRHPDRVALGRELGATDVVSERGAEGAERVHTLTGGYGAHAVLECVGLGEAMETAIAITRPDGAIGRVGVPQDAAMPGSQTAFYHNLTIGCGPAPVRAYIRELLPDIAEGHINPGRVFDRVVDLDGVPDGYRDMNDRKSLKVMIRP